MGSNNNFRKKEIISLILLCFLFVLSLKSVYSSPDDVDNDGYNLSADCNDNNASVFLNLTGYANFDADNFTSAGPITFCTNGTLPIGYSLIQNSEDCNDYNSSVYINLTAFADFDADNFTLGSQLTLCTNGTLPLSYKSVQKSEDCDDLNYSINPNATEIYYNNIDDDCNSLTKDNLTFNIVTSSQSYNIGDAVTFTIYSENRSNVNVSLKVPNNYYVYKSQFLNQTYPITDLIPFTKRVGEYVIMGVETYKGYTVYQNISVNISNSIAISLNGARTIRENESFSLSAVASGGYGSSYNYTWFFNNGTIIRGSNIIYTPKIPDDYDVTINAKDSEGNEKNSTFSLTVKKIYSTRIIVIDKTSEGPISDVNIDLDGNSLVSGGDGSVIFNEVRGKYDLTAYKDGYSIYTNDGVSFYGNSTFIVRMSPIDKSVPVITLYNKTISSFGSSVNIDFSVSDATKTICSIYTSSDSNWWSLIYNISDITTSSKRTFILTNLGDLDYKYKLECTDSGGNTALSDEGIINTVTEVLSITPDSINSTAFTNINELREGFILAKSNIARLGTKENEVYSILGFDAVLKDAERLSTGFERDLDSIQNPRCPGLNCNINSIDRQKRISDLTDKTATSLGNVPLTIEVIHSEEFVKYPTKSDIESGLKTYFESKNKVLTKSQLNSMVEKNFLLQSKVTVSAKIYHLNIVYLNGKNEKLTLIKKDLDLYDKDNSIANNRNYLFIEDISKETSQNSKLSFISQSNILKNNSLFEVGVSEKNIVYTLNQDIASEKAKMANTLLISTSLPESNPIIGFVTSSSPSFKDINYTYLIIGLIFFVIILRLLIMFGIFDSFKNKLFNSDEKEYHSFLMIINDAKDYLSAGDAQKASLVYKEIKLRYENVSVKTRERTYSEILELCSKIDEDYIKTLVNTANDDLSKKDNNHAAKVYFVIENVYKKLKDDSKSVFEDEIKKIYSKITGAN